MATNKKDNNDISINNPHDRALKRVLSEHSAAKSFFQEYLPPQVTRSNVKGILGKF